MVKSGTEKGSSVNIFCCPALSSLFPRFSFKKVPLVFYAPVAKELQLTNLTLAAWPLSFLPLLKGKPNPQPTQSSGSTPEAAAWNYY